MAKRSYMTNFLRNLVVVVVPIVLRLIAEQIESIFRKESRRNESKSTSQER